MCVILFRPSPYRGIKKLRSGLLALLLGARTLLGAKGIATRSKDATSNKCHASSNKCLTSSNKKLLGAPGIATRSKDATRGTTELDNKNDPTPTPGLLQDVVLATSMHQHGHGINAKLTKCILIKKIKNKTDTNDTY